MVRLCFVVWVLRVGVFCCVLIVLILLVCDLLCIATLVVLAWWLRGVWLFVWLFAFSLVAFAGLWFVVGLQFADFWMLLLVVVNVVTGCLDA